MRPASVHLVAQLIRHDRAKWTSMEKWNNAQPPSEATEELAGVIRVMREVLDSYEAQLLKSEMFHTV